MLIPDPDFPIPDPDLGVKKTVFRIRIHLIRIRIQHFRLIANPDPLRIKGIDDQKLKKYTGYLKKCLNFFLLKTAIYLSLGLLKGCSSYGRSLQLSKENIQLFKTCNFLIFSTLVVHFCPPGSGSGFRIRIRIH
jgi:hypothetical protein